METPAGAPRALAAEEAPAEEAAEVWVRWAVLRLTLLLMVLLLLRQRRLRFYFLYRIACAPPPTYALDARLVCRGG